MQGIQKVDGVGMRIHPPLADLILTRLLSFWWHQPIVYQPRAVLGPG
jgi:hypothetical protein